jgi:hypothetical protein
MTYSRTFLAVAAVVMVTAMLGCGKSMKASNNSKPTCRHAIYLFDDIENIRNQALRAFKQSVDAYADLAKYEELTTPNEEQRRFLNIYGGLHGLRSRIHERKAEALAHCNATTRIRHTVKTILTDLSHDHDPSIPKDGILESLASKLTDSGEVNGCDELFAQSPHLTGIVEKGQTWARVQRNEELAVQSACKKSAK